MLELIRFLIAFLIAAAAAHRPKTDLECPVPDLYDQCLAGCRLEYLDCLGQCESSYCHSECLGAFSECDGYCPCGLECPKGCEDCEHQLCEELCQNAQEDNEDYILCQQEALDGFNSCNKECPPDFSCFDSCYADYTAHMATCPCIDNESTSTAATTTTSEPPSLEPADTAIMVFRWQMSQAYILAGDGSTKTPVSVSAPSDNYTEKSAFAVVKDVWYIFGGQSDQNKVAKLEGCAFTQLSARLNFNVHYGGVALAMENSTQAIVCFENTPGDTGKLCDLFDGSTIRSTFSTTYPHSHGSIGHYKGNPTTVGCRYSDGRGKVETLTNSGWTSLNDHPNDITDSHSLVGLKSGSMLAIGGYYPTTSKVWILQNDLWSVAGNLKKPVNYTNSILVGNSVYVISGGYQEDEFPLQRIDLNGDIITDTEILGYHDDFQYWPVIFQADSFDFCVSQ